ncbi:MAG: PHP domain-containing protein [bacterium]
MKNEEFTKRLPYEADLHNHTTFSDGSLTPAQLVYEAHQLGLKALGVTDHDTIDGLYEALSAAEDYPVKIIPGVEITVRFMETFFIGSLHLLAYFKEALLEDEAFLKETSEVLALGRGSALTRSRIERINEVFSPDGSEPLLPRLLTEDDVYAHGDRISRRHFSLALKSMGIHDPAIINRIIGNASPAYVPSGSSLSVLKTYLQKWPLTLVLAHPAAGSFPGENVYREVLPPFEIVDRLMPNFLDVGLAGLEIEYPGHTPEWKGRLRQYLEEKKLFIVTGGSDCHDKTDRPLGLSGVGMAEVEALQKTFKAH